MAKENNNGKFMKIPKSIIVTIILFIVGGAFSYIVFRIDKNTDNITTIRENFATKNDIERLEVKIDKLIDLRIKENKK